MWIVTRSDLVTIHIAITLVLFGVSLAVPI